MADKDIKSNILTHETIKGNLFKKSPSIFQGWQKRYVILKDKKLKYFLEEGAKYPQGVINFDLFMCELKSGEPNEFSIKFTGIDRLFEFQAKDEIEANNWKRVIKIHIDNSMGKLH